MLGQTNSFINGPNLEKPIYLAKTWQAFLLKRVRIPNRFRTSINPGSNEEGERKKKNVKRNDPNK